MARVKIESLHSVSDLIDRQDMRAESWGVNFLGRKHAIYDEGGESYVARAYRLRDDREFLELSARVDGKPKDLRACLTKQKRALAGWSLIAAEKVEIDDCISETVFRFQRSATDADIKTLCL